ncbi:MAG: response regulator [Candidatus Spechtbacterales bacterium]
MTTQPRAVVVEDDRYRANAYIAVLGGEGYEVVAVLASLDEIRQNEELFRELGLGDIILLDRRFPGASSPPPEAGDEAFALFQKWTVQAAILRWSAEHVEEGWVKKPNNFADIRRLVAKTTTQHADSSRGRVGVHVYSFVYTSSLLP